MVVQVNLYILLANDNGWYDKMMLSYSQDIYIGILSAQKNNYNNITFQPKYYNHLYISEWEYNSNIGYIQVEKDILFNGIFINAQKNVQEDA